MKKQGIFFITIGIVLIFFSNRMLCFSSDWLDGFFGTTVFRNDS